MNSAGNTVLADTNINLTAANAVIDLTDVSTLNLNTVTNRPITTGTGLFTAGGSATVTSDLGVNGNTTLGNAITDTLTFTARVAQDADLIPIGTTGTSDLGTSALPWDNTYSTAFVGNSLDTLTGTTLTIGPTTATAITVGAATIPTTVVGNLTLTAGRTLAVNGDAFTDLTGNGLTVTGNALTVLTDETGAVASGLSLSAAGVSAQITRFCPAARVSRAPCHSTGQFHVCSHCNGETGSRRYRQPERYGRPWRRNAACFADSVCAGRRSDGIQRACGWRPESSGIGRHGCFCWSVTCWRF